MTPFPEDRARSFTLIEVVIAIGILTFALIGMVLLLGNALRSSMETQRDSALTSALMTSSALVRGFDSRLTSTNLYFDQQGTPVSNTTTQAYFHFALQSVGAGAGPTNLDHWTVKATAPYPATNSVGTFFLNRVKE